MGTQFSPETLRVSTHDNVSLTYVTAGIGSRSLAMLADGTAASILALIVFTLVGDAVNLPSTDGSVAGEIGLSMASVVAEVSAVASFLLYFLLSELLTRGRTIGKALTGIRVIHTDGSSLRLSGAVLRNLIRLIDMGALIGLVVMFASPRAQRLGDYAAGTVVVRERRASSPGRIRVEAPVYLRTWDPGLPVLGLEHLGPHEHGVIRSLLQRPDISPVQRATVAAALAAKLCDRLQLPPEASERLEDPEHLVERLYLQLQQRG